MAELCADNCKQNPPPMRGAPVLEEENSLPGSELHFPIDNRDRLARAGQCHADVRRAVVAAFSRVHEVIGIFRDEPLKKFLEIFSRGRIGVLHDDEAATGVLNENRCYPVTHICLVDPGLNFAGDLVVPFASCSDKELLGLDAHRAMLLRNAKSAINSTFSDWAPSTEPLIFGKQSASLRYPLQSRIGNADFCSHGSGPLRAWGSNFGVVESEWALVSAVLASVWGWHNGGVGVGVGVCGGVGVGLGAGTSYWVGSS